MDYVFWLCALLLLGFFTDDTPSYASIVADSVVVVGLV